MNEWPVPEYDLEKELMNSDLIKNKVKDPIYAQKLYAAMCNIQWLKDTQKNPWSISWRGAGDVVSALIGEGDYLDYYCSGIIPYEMEHSPLSPTREGNVDPQIENDLAQMGWHWQYWSKEGK